MSPGATIYQYIQRIVQADELTPTQKIGELFQLFDRIYADAVKREKIAFTTLFARVAYVALKFRYTEEQTLVIQTFRKHAMRLMEQRPAKIKEIEIHIALSALLISVEKIYEDLPTEQLLALVPANLTKKLKPTYLKEELPHLQVLAIGVGSTEDTLLVIPDVSGGQPVQMLYNLPDRNQNFKATIDVILKITDFPVLLNLIDIGIDQAGRFRPRALIIEPDYLFDISSISECFQQNATEPFNYLVKKFVQSPPTLAIHIGNVANYFLDRLISEPQNADFGTLLMEAFKANPLQFSLLTDDEIKDLQAKCRQHYQTIVAMVYGAFQKQGIDPAKCLVEPSFYSAKYGLQGRLDLFYHTPQESAIIELKSGAPFHPNAYGLARTHFTQTLLYGLLISSVIDREGTSKHPIAKYILYSKETNQPLRFAPDVPSEQMEALQVRNQILGIEYLMTKITPGTTHVPVLARMASGQIKAKGFSLTDYQEFQKHYSALDQLERKYFNAFAGFIAREHWASRAGDTDSDRKGGLSALWKKTYAEKELQYVILGHLRLINNRADQEDRMLVFQKTELTNPMANFRDGDIVLMYPARLAGQNVLDHQIIKGSILHMSSDEVHVRLRHQQFNKTAFEHDDLWHLEADSMESGFVSQYQSLFKWAATSQLKRDLLIGVRPPRNFLHEAEKYPMPEGMLEDQALVFQEILTAQDYYLLWGPPGTGKTSVMLRNLAEHWLRKTDETVLYVAFTNRAVDEICEAFESIPATTAEHIYYRIGSEMSTDPRFRHKLLEQKIKPCKTRSEIKQIIRSHRMVVGTVSSLQSQEALFQLTKFDRIVIDEASQLLEPQILGLLTKCSRALLIGDHKQLPAVCTQAEHLSLVTDADLNQIGINDMRNSYFERMYTHAIAQNWTWAYGRLYHQGRMHADIMHFPSERFYASGLKVMPNTSKQKDFLAYGKSLTPTTASPHVFDQRVAFWPTPHAAFSSLWQKTNTIEAERIVQIYLGFRAIYAENQLEWNENTFGVITPWRAQIAAIKAAFAATQTPTTQITIDTVERYQGGAREIIVISLCTHSIQQMESLISEGAGGVDRKLNVALTRARKHLIVLGVKEILATNTHYRHFVEAYEV
jgi:DNA replication ATP-dependent helicase Dna2